MELFLPVTQPEEDKSYRGVSITPPLVFHEKPRALADIFGLPLEQFIKEGTYKPEKTKKIFSDIKPEKLQGANYTIAHRLNGWTDFPYGWIVMDSNSKLVLRRFIGYYDRKKGDGAYRRGELEFYSLIATRITQDYGMTRDEMILDFAKIESGVRAATDTLRKLCQSQDTDARLGELEIRLAKLAAELTDIQPLLRKKYAK